MTDLPRIVLIDLSSLFWAAWHVNSENGMQQARSITLAQVKNCAGEGESLVVVCCDSGKSFRKELSPDYKANREKQPAAAYGELEKTKDRLRADGYLLWQAEGFEADDVIATACRKARDIGHEVRVCSADKDLCQLLGPGVEVLRTHIGEVWDSQKIMEKFRIDAGQLTDFLALKGDKSDNVAGCPGIGDVRAAELLTKYETLARIYEALDAGKTVSTPANEKSLRENRAQVELSRKLVELRYDVPIRFDEIFEERKTQPLTGENGDMDQPAEEFSDPKSNAPVATEADTAAGVNSNGQTEPAPQSTSGDTAIARYVAPVEFERQLEPTSIGTAFKLARGLFDSRLYSRFNNPEAIMAVIIRGREMGLGALTALDSFHMIEGRPAPHAYLMIARAKADPDCEYFQCVDTNGETATWETKNRRNPKVTRLTFTLEQAKASGLVKPGQSGRPNQWMVRPAEMVRKTCGVQLARMEYPAATMCLYAWEELGGDEP